MTKTLFDFSKSLECNSWFLINDDVMGGLSSSIVRNSNLGLLFSGHISVKNNGGFASVRTQTFPQVFQKTNGFEITLLGDGRHYDFLCKEADSKVTYRQTFKAFSEQQTITLPLDQFRPTRRGRAVEAPQIDPEKITEIGFILADGNEGTFKLLIYKIRMF